MGGSANVDGALRGYYTKYDCSAADINPIGGINKRDLKAFLKWAAVNKGIGVLESVANAMPTAELRPEEGEAGKESAGSADAQSDEKDMGMSYAELGDLGHCRKVEHLGPLGTFLKLRALWACPGRVQPASLDEKVAQKVKDFFFYHVINRH